MKAHLSWIYAHVGRPVKYKVEKKGEDSTLTAVKVGSPPRDTLGLEILCAADHKAYYQHNQHIAQIFKFILDSYKMVEVLMKISF